MFLTVAICKDTGKLVLLNQQGAMASEAVTGTLLIIDSANPFALQPISSGLEVKVLPLTEALPSSRIQAMMAGPPEAFRAEIGFSNPESAPAQPTIALWLAVREDGVPKTHEFLVGGPSIDVKFTMARFFGLDGKSAGGADVEIQARQDTSLMKFRQGSNVSEWELLHVKFQDSLSSPGYSIDWSEGAAIYVRWRVSADPSTNEPGHVGHLVLEALVLKGGPVLESLAPKVKSPLSSGAATTFFLFSTTAVWHGASSRCGLAITPGLFMGSEPSTQPSEAALRWKIGMVLEQARRGSFTKGLDWEEYLKDPTLSRPQKPVPISFVVPLAEDPSFQLPSDRGLPSAQHPDQLAKALHGVAKAAVNARHPGPQSTAEDPLEILAAGGWLAAGDPARPAPGYYTSSCGQTRSHDTYTYQTPSGPPVAAQANQSTNQARIGMDQFCVTPAPLPSEHSANVDNDLGLHHAQNTLVQNTNGFFPLNPPENQAPPAGLAAGFPALPAGLPAPEAGLPAPPAPPLNWKQAMKNCPVDQTPIFIQHDLSHVGLHPFNRKTVKSLHIRANRNLRLQHFSNKNLRKLQEEKHYNLSGGQMVEGKGYTEIKTVPETVLAFHNYEQLMRSLHNMDIGPQALFRTVMEHNLAGTIPSVSFLATFFEWVVGQNAYRADIGQVSLTYEECCQKWDFLLRTSGAASTAPLFHADTRRQPLDSAMTSALQGLTRALGKFEGRGVKKPCQSSPAPPAAGAGQNPNKKKKNKNIYCNMFNTPGGCSNTQRPGGCVDQAGVEFRHGCNIRIQPGNRACNRTDHNSLNH